MSEARRISVEEGKRLVDGGYRYVDVRTEEEYAAGHAAGAVNVPFMLSGPGRMVPNPQFLAVMCAAFDKREKLLIACAAGGRSLKAAAALCTEGFSEIVELRPGYGGLRNAFGQIVEPGWQAAGMPIELATAGGSYLEIKKQFE